MKTGSVLDVGQCDPDHGSIRQMLEKHFDVQIDRVMFVEEAQQALREKRYDLVLVNRLIFADQSDGSELIRRMKAESDTRDTPVMLVSNYAEAQTKAVADGALQGFGKASLDDPQTIERLAQILPRRATTKASTPSR